MYASIRFTPETVKMLMGRLQHTYPRAFLARSNQRRRCHQGFCRAKTRLSGSPPVSDAPPCSPRCRGFLLVQILDSLPVRRCWRPVQEALSIAL